MGFGFGFGFGFNGSRLLTNAGFGRIIDSSIMIWTPWLRLTRFLRVAAAHPSPFLDVSVNELAGLVPDDFLHWTDGSRLFVLVWDWFCVEKFLEYFIRRNQQFRAHFFSQ
jgi:hypothetical protein